MSAPNIFVSYRRGVDNSDARGLQREIEAALGADSVFLDVEDMAQKAGLDFHVLLERQIAQCSAFVAVIGQGWIDAMPRLHNDDDWVRAETRQALARKDIRVIPVLIDGAPFPGKDDLPEDLLPLLRRNALVLRHGDYRNDIKKIIANLQGRRRPPWVVPAIAGGIAACLILGFTFREELIDARCKMSDQPWEISYCG